MITVMMSGQAGIAVAEDGSVYSTEVDTFIDRDTAIRQLAGCVDLALTSADSEEAIRIQLEYAWKRDRTLQLVLVLLDGTEDADTRREAAECLADLFADSTLTTFVADRLYAAPMPSSGDIKGARLLSERSGALTLMSLLIELEDDQAEIRRRVDAWENLPISLFGTFDAKDEFRSELIAAGAFRIFVTERLKHDLALFHLLSHPTFRGRHNARTILQAWAAPFRESVRELRFSRTELHDTDFQAPRVVDTSKRFSGHKAFENVGLQKAAIKRELAAGNVARAFNYTETLIETQKARSEPEHLAKSLCDIAQFAKDQGSPELQLQFAQLATTNAPDDAWAHVTVADAHRSLGQYQEAIQEFRRAGILGSQCMALLGHAEVLRELGQIDEALGLYERCAHEFRDSVALTSRAAALDHCGFLDRALSAYDALLQDDAYNLVALTGRAQVLRHLGRPLDALAALDRVIELFPSEPIAAHINAELLREIGRFDESTAAFERFREQFPERVEGWIGYARLLRDSGRYIDAISELRKAVAEFPLSGRTKIALAEALRHSGATEEAETLYNSLMESSSVSGRAKTGLARIRAARGEYPIALQMLPFSAPATLGDWIVYHVRAVTLMKSGDLRQAQTLLEAGLDAPWRALRPQFELALAVLFVRQNRNLEALDRLDSDSPAKWLRALFSLMRLQANVEVKNQDNFALAQALSVADLPPTVALVRDDILSRRLNARTSEAAFLHICDSLLLAA